LIPNLDALGGLGGQLADLVGTVRIESALRQHQVAEIPVDTTSPCPVAPVAAVNTSSSAMSPPPLRRRFPCPTVPVGAPMSHRGTRADFPYR
jgi:hypothetical protein